MQQLFLRHGHGFSVTSCCQEERSSPHLVPSDSEAPWCASGMGGSCARGKGVRKSQFLALLGGATLAPSLHKVQVLQTQKGVLTLGSSHRQQTPTHPFRGMHSVGFLPLATSPHRAFLGRKSAPPSKSAFRPRVTEGSGGLEKC